MGKTAASVHLAKMLDTEIVSCDSMQIYKGMDIGTAKVTPGEAQGIKHHMIDVISPLEGFSVRDYVAMASPIIEDIASRGKIALVVGGTGLYADSLIKGIDFSDETGADEKYRQEMLCLAKAKGNDYVHNLLRDVDEKSAEAIHPNNIKRVIRALEYYHISGERISDYNERTKKIPSPYDSVRFYFNRDRQNLYNRIDMRVDKMLKDGLVDEVKALVDMGLDISFTAMQALGYKEIADYIAGRITLEEATELIKSGTRHYAKRQLTWFKRDKEGIWLNLDDFSSPEEVAKMCKETMICKKQFL